MKNIKKQKKESSERWLLTYSDLITLLMILFILLYAMSTVDQGKYDKLSGSLSDSMGEGASLFRSFGIFPGGGNGTNIGESGGEQQPTQAPPMVTETPPEATKIPEEAVATPAVTEEAQNTEVVEGNISTEKDMANFETNVNDILTDMNFGVSVATTIKARGLTISFANDIFFDSGQAILKEDMKIGLSKIAKLLNNVNNSVIIEGHTDNVPISKSSKFSSNWQLSADRAANVVEYLVKEGNVDGTRMAAVGYGEYQPKASNDTKKGRSQNRRIDIIILYDNEGSMENK